MLGPFATASRFTLPFTWCRYCRTPPAHRCPRQRQRQRVTEGTAMAPWNGPSEFIIGCSICMNVCRNVCISIWMQIWVGYNLVYTVRYVVSLYNSCVSTVESLLLWCIHTHAALGWDGMGWAALVTQCISIELGSHIRCVACAVLRGAGKMLLVFYQRASKVRKEACSSLCYKHRTATGTHVPYGITQCYLPPGRGDIPAFTPAN